MGGERKARAGRGWEKYERGEGTLGNKNPKQLSFVIM